MADTSRIALHRIEATGPPCQPRELAPQAPEILDPLIEFCRPARQQLGNVIAWRLAAITKPDYRADLPEAEAEGLASLYEAKTGKYVPLVFAVPRL